MRLLIGGHTQPATDASFRKSDSCENPLALILWIGALIVSCAIGVYFRDVDGLVVGVATLAAFLSLAGIMSACPHIGHR